MDVGQLLTPLQRETIQIDYRRNHDCFITAELNAVSVDLVREVVGLCNNKPNCSRDVPQELRTKIAYEYIYSCDHKLNLGDRISKKYGIPKATIQSWARKFRSGNIRSNSLSTEEVERRKQLVRQWLEVKGKIPMKEFADEHGVKIKALAKWRTDYGKDCESCV